MVPDQAPPGNPEQAAPETGGLEQRIDQLVARFHDADKRAEQSASLNEKYNETINSLQTQISTLEQRLAGQGAGDDPLAELFSASSGPGRKPQQPAIAGAQFSNILRDVIKAELAPIRQEQEARSRRDDLRQMQQAAFNEMARDIPELADQSSPEFKAFASLVSRTPEHFEGLGEFAPALYGLAARGLAQGTVRDQADLTERKRVADITRPTHAPTPPRERATIPQSTQTATKAQQYISQLQEKGERSGWDDNDMGQYLTLKLGRYQE